jgi:hypothetical protein
MPIMSMSNNVVLPGSSDGDRRRRAHAMKECIEELCGGLHSPHGRRLMQDNPQMWEAFNAALALAGQGSDVLDQDAKERALKRYRDSY